MQCLCLPVFLAQIFLPPVFFLLMWIPRNYIHPVHHGQIIAPTSIDLESRAWSGPNPYSGWSASHAEREGLTVDGMGPWTVLCREEGDHCEKSVEDHGYKDRKSVV